MKLFLVLPVVLSHGFALIPTLIRTSKGKMLRTVDFAVLGMLLFYDVALVCEVLGVDYESEFFLSMLKVPPSLQLSVIAILVFAPWLLRLGGEVLRVAAKPRRPRAASPRTTTRPYGVRNRLITIAMIGFSIGLAIYGIMEIVRYGTPGIARLRVGHLWGRGIIVLYLPMHFLAYHVSCPLQKRFQQIVVTSILLFCSVAATLPIGQRTNFLLPFLIVLVSRRRLSFKKIVSAAVVLSIVAAVVLPLFDAQYTHVQQPIGRWIQRLIYGDFSRAPVLATAIDNSPLVGTKLLPYPLAGYVYSLLFFAPRSIAPFKGEPTAKYFTSYVAGTPVEETNWGFGVGLIEELILNMGVAMVPFGLLGWGMLLALLDIVSRRLPVLYIPSRLGAVWLMGYHLPAVLLTFGTMGIIGYLLYLLTVRYRSLPARLRREDPHTKDRGVRCSKGSS